MTARGDSGSGPHAGATSPSAQPSARRREALWDVVVVLLVLVLVRWSMVPVTERYAGTLSSLSALVLATWRLSAGGRTWLDVGLRPSLGAWRTALASIAVFVVVIAVVLPPTLVVESLVGRPDQTARFGDLQGDLGALLWWGSLSILIGGFVEEMVYRGFVLSRLTDLLGATRAATGGAILLQASFFGFRHFYWQGTVGAVAAFLAALVFGVAYFACKRNLWPLIIAHGVIDLLGFAEDFLGV